MYVDTSIIRRNEKTYTRHLLRTSFREGGKVKHRTIANISSCGDEEIAAIKLALKNKKNLSELASLDEIRTTLGKKIGAVWAVKTIAERVGVAKALGDSPEAKKALLQVIARLIDQGSRLSAVRFAERHALCEILGIERLNEDDLYKNLAWLAEEQGRIETELYRRRFSGTTPTLFLYDVTSSYLEGDCNALATWGYNRDKKDGKKQVVIGLLTGPDGLPVAVRVFEGNTVDTKTVAEQVRILAEQFGVKNVTLVGDRGMIKGPQIEALPDDFRYITAISKPQIQTMLAKGVLQCELFSDRVCEIEEDGVRYVLRRNPIRKKEMADTRASKRASIIEFAHKQTTYLAEHPRADVVKAVARVTAKIKRLNADKWLSVSGHERTLSVSCDPDALAESALLDGCYVVKSDVSKDAADAQTLHDRYCDLEMVERSFRTMKTSHLDLRPIFVRTESSTRGHVFVVMLALLLQREFEDCWRELDTTVAEGLDELGGIHSQEVQLRDVTIQDIPRPNKFGARLLAAARVVLPSVLPQRTAYVSTKKKLPSERISK